MNILQDALQSAKTFWHIGHNNRPLCLPIYYHGEIKNTRQKTEKMKKIIVKSVDVGKSICYSYQTRKDLGLFFMLKIR